MNASHCLENLYAVISPSASQVNTRGDFAAIFKSRARPQGRVSTKQTTETKICVHKFTSLMLHSHKKVNLEGKPCLADYAPS